MQHVTDGLDGRRWARIEETRDDAMRASRITRTGVGHYLAIQLGKEVLSDYYVLFDPSGETGLAAVQIPRETSKRVPLGPSFDVHVLLVSGNQNRNPFPEFGADIETLGHRLGVDLPESCYPYGRRAPEPDDDADPAPPEPGR